MRNFGVALCFIVLAVSVSIKTAAQQYLDLAGRWSYALDPDDKGVKEEWFRKAFQSGLNLPGSLSSNGIGDEITLNTPWTGQIVDSSYFKDPEYAEYRVPGNIKIPFWLQPLKYYKGAAWYQKEIEIPSDWNNKSVVLILERCHWESSVWIDENYIGFRNSLGAPHSYEMLTGITPGRHKISIRIDNRIKDIDPGYNSHSVSDHTQSNWNGIIGKMLLEAHPLVNIKEIQVHPDVSQNMANIRLTINNTTKHKVQPTLSISITGNDTVIKNVEVVSLELNENKVDINISMGPNAKLWDEFNPDLYQLKVELSEPDSDSRDIKSVSFGMRSFRVNGNQILINGRPVFLRGTLECAIFPQTGFPPMEKDEWLRIFRICKSYGLNHVRFHSWCPPEAAFAAADQTGLYLQIECSSWANSSSSTIGDGKPIDQFIYEESKDIVRAYGNHPSFCMMAYGNEPAGANQAKYLGDFINYWKELDKRRIYTSGGGWPIIPESDYLSSPDPRIQGWGQGLQSIINASPPASDFDWGSMISKFDRPVVSHEIGQWCAYPDFREINRKDAVLKARNFEIFQQSLSRQGMEHLADSFLLASGKLQSLCYKADIEAALRTPNFGGFQLLDLHDFPGQGTALVGVLNAFWEEKGYITSEEYSKFCNSTVPLARFNKFVYLKSEQLSLPLEVAHFGKSPLKDCIPEWSIKDTDGKTIQSGKLPVTNIQVGNAIPIGEIAIPLLSFQSPSRYKFELKIRNFVNDWDFWVYPDNVELIKNESSVRVVQEIDEDLISFLEAGGTALISVPAGRLNKAFGGDIKTGFSTIFWNTAWTNGQPPHTLGILCNPQHPAFKQFPTEFHSNYQWWDAMNHAQAIELKRFKNTHDPIVRIIDDWFTNRPLALLMEGKVGKGKVLITGIDLFKDVSSRIEAKQLIYSLKQYMSGADFNPASEIYPSELLQLLNH